MTHWVKYKDQYINLSRIRGFTVDRLRKSRKGEAVAMYTGDLKVDKSKPWVLYADHHQPIDAFKSKAEALKVADDMISGKYDVKT